MPEHFLIPPAHVPLSGDHYFDSTTAQAFLAGSTSRIRLASLVTILPLHQPVVLDKAIASLDWFSGGRATLAVGVGWLKEEFDAMGVPFAKRGRVTDEYLAAILELWHSDSPSYDGPFVSFHDVTFGPKPIQKPHPPIWIGGDADAAIRRAARFADGWSPWLTQPDQLPARLDFLRSQPGFDDRPFDICYSPGGLTIGEGHVETNDPNAQFGQSAQEIIDGCSKLANMGVTVSSVLPPPLPDLETFLDHMRWIAEDVVPHVP
jgi:probable F420-dependent oxidoreductase